MKRLLLVTSIAALMMSSAAFASPGNGKDKHHDQKKSHAYEAQGKNPKVHGHHDNGLHLGHQKKAWKRGEHLPREYLADRYYIEDYRAYRLDAPPRGYRWVRPYQDSNEYLLVQVTTGIISQILGY